MLRVQTRNKGFDHTYANNVALFPLCERPLYMLLRPAPSLLAPLRSPRALFQCYRDYTYPRAIEMLRLLT